LRVVTATERALLVTIGWPNNDVERSDRVRRRDWYFILKFVRKVAVDSEDNELEALIDCEGGKVGE
jgi:hypothetical protein